MKLFKLLILICCFPLALEAQINAPLTEKAKADAQPWVFWYWVQGGVSKGGIRADLEAMKAAGIGGAYLMSIKGPAKPPVYTPAAQQLTPLWWDMVGFAMQEAGRLGLKLGMHVSDGFALAGGPWITPELSMQKIVSTQVDIDGGKLLEIRIPQPESNERYYRDIAVYGFPTLNGAGISTKNVRPVITTNLKDQLAAAQRLIAAEPAQKGQSFKAEQPCWITYAFEQPFTCRSVKIATMDNSFQAQRLLMEVSNDGINFHSLGRLHSPRHGWQDTDAAVTHSIKATTAKYFRFVFDPAGSLPGAEDLDGAKWKPTLKLSRMELSSAPVINQFESKNGEVWRISERSSDHQLPTKEVVAPTEMINLTKYQSASGTLTWKAPKGKWTIIRMGHTSTGHTNATGGGGAGLEVDKFNAEAIKLQFNSWYGEAIKQAAKQNAKDVLRVFHVDSWECGSQNWSESFPSAFRQRRGYDLLPWLPLMAGIPIESAEKSEQVLYDVRRTIAELVVDTFYHTLAGLAKENGVVFSAESVAPTMLSDGLMHYKKADLPMGEYWLNSPTHDKPNDVLDAISGAHIYGKPIIQAEAFTTVRMAWNEHPGMLKTLQDRNYALGINKVVYHVFTHNPWMNRKPGMTLDGVGLYFQRDQTWWRPGKVWIDYATRSQVMLQKGQPVVDIAVFTGEEYPRRALLPDRLVKSLPGIFGAEVVRKEAARLANLGQPMREIPAGVRHSANMADPEQWVDPLHGYAYDSFNPDVLMQAVVKEGRVVFPSGMSYQILIFPRENPMDPNWKNVSPEVQHKIDALRAAGARIISGDGDLPFNVPYKENSFESLGLPADLSVADSNNNPVRNIAWNHRQDGERDIYFVANQEQNSRLLNFSFRAIAPSAALYNAVDDTQILLPEVKVLENRTVIPLKLAPQESVFIILGPKGKANSEKLLPGSRPARMTPKRNWPDFMVLKSISSDWKVKFDPASGGSGKEVLFNILSDWTLHQDSLIRYYSGTAIYTKDILLDQIGKKELWLDLGKIANIASIRINGMPAGVLWTPPFRINIGALVKKGLNKIEIEVTNTWANRLIGDHRLPESERQMQTTAPFRLDNGQLQEAGLLGPVSLLIEK